MKLIMFLMEMDGSMDELRFYVLSNSISVISGRLAGDNGRLYTENKEIILTNATKMHQYEENETIIL